MGDFNLHHPLWSRPGYEHIHAEADELFDVAMDHELTQQLPRGTITYGGWSTAKPRRLPSTWSGPPEFDLSVIAAPEIIRKNWKATDWDAFLKQMSHHDWYLPPLSNKDGIDKAVGQRFNAINEAANRSTPEIRITEQDTPRKWLNYEMRPGEPAEGPGTPIVMKIGSLSARPGTALAGRLPGLRNPSTESGLKRVPNQLTASGRWPGGHEAEGQQGPRSPPR